jgi:alpha-methylacyl-CoA racemase
MLLADLGAEVTRVERPPSEVAPAKASQRVQYEVLHRGRISTSLNLKAAEGHQIAMRLIENADMVLEGFRPGVAERLGLGPADCHKRNQRLIYGRMTGWGQTGPLAASAGHDINYIALTGALDAIGRAGGPPVFPLNLLGDFGAGGTFLALGMVSALWESRRSGHGQVIDAAIVDGTASLMTMLLGMYSAEQWSNRRGTNSLDGGAPYYEVYECADGKWISVGAIEPQFYGALLEGLGLPDNVDYERSDPLGWPSEKQRIASAFRTRTRDEWCRHFDQLDACVEPVLSIDEATQHPHNRQRRYIDQLDGVMQPGSAPRFSRTPGLGPRRVPAPGEHTREVLRSLGMDDQEICDLIERGVVHCQQH